MWKLPRIDALNIQVLLFLFILFTYVPNSTNCKYFASSLYCIDKSTMARKDPCIHAIVTKINQHQYCPHARDRSTSARSTSSCMHEFCGQRANTRMHGLARTPILCRKRHLHMVACMSDNQEPGRIAACTHTWIKLLL